jgi:hypothetical protein
MKINQFNRPSLHMLRASLDEALKAVADRHGIVLKTGHISFTANTCSIRIEGSTIDPSGVVHSREAEDFKINAELHGLTPEHLNRTFVSAGVTYKLVGYRIKAPKKPFIIEDEAGRKFVGTEDMIRRAFGIEPRKPLFSSVR